VRSAIENSSQMPGGVLIAGNSKKMNETINKKEDPTKRVL
jgi:hypothetical protein